jgi:hypothetical protein
MSLHLTPSLLGTGVLGGLILQCMKGKRIRYQQTGEVSLPAGTRDRGPDSSVSPVPNCEGPGGALNRLRSHLRPESPASLPSSRCHPDDPERSEGEEGSAVALRKLSGCAIFKPISAWPATLPRPKMSGALASLWRCHPDPERSEGEGSAVAFELLSRHTSQLPTARPQLEI